MNRAIESASGSIKKQIETTETIRKSFDALNDMQTELIKQLANLEKEESKSENAINEMKKELEQSAKENKELSEENQLLLAELHSSQEEMERYFRELQELSGQSRKQSGKPSESSERRMLENKSDLEEYFVDFSKDEIQGQAWHDEMEPGGRWAGPATQSTILIPFLKPQKYLLEILVVGEVEEGLLKHTEFFFLGTRVYPTHGEGDVPTTISMEITVPEVVEEGISDMEYKIRVPKTIAPFDRGEPDRRYLSLKLNTLSVGKISD